jgi:hypothetical protein
MTTPRDQGTNDRFDASIRAAHADALDHLSPRTRAQLQQRRRAALAGTPARAPANPFRFVLPLAAAFAIGAVAIGVGMRLQPESTDAAAPRVASVTPAPATTTTDDTAYATLEENPDLYLWLASEDAATLAME